MSGADPQPPSSFASAPAQRPPLPGRPGGQTLARPMVIAIDGPAGAGKSTVTKLVSRRLGILLLDTGAMYRAATVRVLAAGIDADDPVAVAGLVRHLHIDFSPAGVVRVDGEELGDECIRAPGLTDQVWRVADNPACRVHLVALQQALVRGQDCVVEGRDATTVICPDAQLKVYLDASPEERARRRMSEWTERYRKPSLDEVAASIRARDARDTGRSMGALKLADDALRLLTDGMPVDGVVARIIGHAVKRHPFLLERVTADQLVVGRSRAPGYVKVAEGAAHGEAPSGWQLGLSNPSPERIPGGVSTLTRNHGGRQAGTLVQGSALLVLGGRSERPGRMLALPMLPQTWYVIEPLAWHAVVQRHGTICAWAESANIREEYADLDPTSRCELDAYLDVLLPE